MLIPVEYFVVLVTLTQTGSYCSNYLLEVKWKFLLYLHFQLSKYHFGKILIIQTLL